MENQNGLKSLISRLVFVMGGVERIPKNGYNDFHRYAYATEADVSDHIRKLLFEHNIFMISSVEETANRDITTRSGKNETIVRVKIKVTFYCGETGENLSFYTWGDGQDAGDKGIYKAITGAVKYALMKNFLIPTGDDPENDNGKKTDKNSGASAGGSTASKQAKPKPKQDESEEILTVQGLVENIETKEGISKPTNKKWIKYIIQMSAGKYSTFDKTIASNAANAQAEGLQFEIKYTYDPKFGNTIKEAYVTNIGDAPF